ncbi:MAG: DUF3089 domain-containing protein [Alphaproteobacteria bacterium]|nr:DUF3089 domain-containing protein [Alphaproteobacteria bacterium]MBV9373431.1 DUF3089 domain-containing protein [Alphaproteobacteria bacterium]MBV9900973.1 DUF3089 domain-containing protein [Alphaproteobacteria bacterium]
MIALRRFAAALLLAGAPAAAQPAASGPPPAPAAAGLPATASPAPDYTQDAAWLCLPGRGDICSMPLATAALNPNGYGSVGQVRPAQDAAADCFYIYPTVSRDRSLNSDLEAGREEMGAAASQFARFGSVCRTFAPVYRQVTTGALPLAFTGYDVRPNFEMAYADVLAAWKEFLAHRNKDRPFVVVGHSQGAIHAIRLIREEIEGKPVAKRMLSAVLAGWAVEVPPGKLVGGSFKSTPLCTREGQTGCVLTWMSFRADSPPPPGSFLGRAATPGMTAGCTNPAALGSDKAAPLDSYWLALTPTPAGAEPVVWSKEGPPATPYLRTEGLATGQCRHDGQAGWLAVGVNADPSDPRTDRIPGDVYIGGQLNRGWGMHLADMSVAQGDVLRLVAAQVRAFSATPATRSTPKPPPPRRR